VAVETTGRKSRWSVPARLFGFLPDGFLVGTWVRITSSIAERWPPIYLI
jgi:hypothetical protein